MIVEIKYKNFNKFIKISGYDLINIGEYSRNDVIVVKMLGIEIFKFVLDEDIYNFRMRNYIEFKNN